MAVVAAWLTNRGDAAGGQTRASTRLAPVGTWWPTGELTSRSGLVPGGSPCLVTGTGMTASVAVGRAVIQGSTAAGAYDVAVTVAESVPIPNGDPANPRRDLIGIRVYNDLVDASGETMAVVERLAGTPAPSPVDPTPEPGATWLPLARVAVPANASAGSPITWGTAVTDMREHTVAAGGILPPDASNADGSYVGQVRIITGRLHQWTGSAWAEFTLPSAVEPSTWGAWTAYTPAWTGLTALGSSVSTGRWARHGRKIELEATLTWGTGSVLGSGAIRVSVPVPPVSVSSVHSWTGGGTLRPAGGGVWYPIITGLDGGSTTAALFRQRADLGLVVVGEGSPSWASGATLRATLTYEAAS